MSFQERLVDFFCYLRILMKSTAIIGLALLFMVWLWLAWMLLAYGGVTLKNLLLLAMTAVIIFVPLLKKFGIGAKNSKK